MLSPVCTLSGHEQRVWCVNWSPTEDVLASCSQDKTVRVWHPLKTDAADDAWKCTEVVKFGHTRSVRAVAFSPCGRFMITASFDSTAIVWMWKDDEWEQYQTLEGHENELKCAAYSASGRFVATCSRDKSVWVWEGACARRACAHVQHAVDEENDLQCCSILQAHTADVKMCVWHPQEEILVSCSYDNTIRFYAFDPDDDWVVTSTLNDAHHNTVWAVAFDSDGRHLVSVGADSVLKVWRMHRAEDRPPLERDTWHCVCTLPPTAHCGEVIYSVDWCPFTDHIVTGAGDNTIRIFRCERQVTTFDLVEVEIVANAHDDDVNCVRWARRRQRAGVLATCGDDCMVKLWKFNV